MGSLVKAIFVILNEVKDLSSMKM